MPVTDNKKEINMYMELLNTITIVTITKMVGLSVLNGYIACVVIDLVLQYQDNVQY